MLPGDPDPEAVRNERAKTTASYLNGAAGAGVVAPLAARVFGVIGSKGSVPPLTLAVGVLIFSGVSLGSHAAARYVLKGSRR